jgi:hypothetical protein
LLIKHTITHALSVESIKIEIPLHVKKKHPQIKTVIFFPYHQLCPPVSSNTDIEKPLFQIYPKNTGYKMGKNDVPLTWAFQLID